MSQKTPEVSDWPGLIERPLLVQPHVVRRVELCLDTYALGGAGISRKGGLRSWAAPSSVPFIDQGMATSQDDLHCS